MIVHIIIITIIKQIGKVILSIGRPKAVPFSNFIPCVSGSISANFCKAVGMISYGSVAPENISIGKYKILATVLAVFMFGAIPPTIIPMLNIDSMTNKNDKKKCKNEPII